MTYCKDRFTVIMLFMLLIGAISFTAHAQDTDPEATDPANIEEVVEVEAEDVAPEDADPAGEGTAEPEGFVANLNAFLDSSLGSVNDVLDKTLFLKIGGAPLVVIILIFGGVFFTIFFGFKNIFWFKHAIDVVRGKFDDPEDEGEVSHFRALTSALSATVGLGNIAGVAIAISMGGPGAVFWMTLAGFFGMSAKFVECTLGQMYRKVNPDGTISGGGMYYLQKGFAEFNHPIMAVIGKVLAVIFAVFIMGAALGGGNMFQANQSFEVFRFVFDVSPKFAFIYGIILAILVALVVVGGIKRIGAATSKLVPAMAAIYVLAALFIMITNITEVPGAIITIFTSAFDSGAVEGGIIGIIVIGVQRASFSSEAGLGSAAIAHSAAKTDEPAREGAVALLEPFIDTIIICNMTAIVIVLSGIDSSQIEGIAPGVQEGAVLTKLAFEQAISWFPYVLAICVILFAYSTMISWCYYGERAWIYLLDHLGEGTGIRSLIVFRIIFVFFVYIGAVLKLNAVLGFSDYLLLSLAFPNVIGCIILAPKVKRAVDDYWRKVQSGEA